MGDAKNAGRSILIVDDEEALAWSLYGRLRKQRSDYRVQTASEAETALAKFKRRPFDLLVADVRMPGMSGVDLILAARKLYPQLPAIVMTAFKTAEIARLEGGAPTAFLDKPFEFDRFLSLVDEMLADEPGFSGAISVPTLPDVVQLYILSSTTGALSVRHGSDEGTLWFDNGAISHAVTNDAAGEEAFYEVMTWRGGEFSMRANELPPARSIHRHWQELIIESCRRNDERARAVVPARSRSLLPPMADDDRDDSFEGFVLNEITWLTKTVSEPTNKPQEVTVNIKDSLARLNQADGFVGAALVDSESGMLLGQEGGGNLNLEVAAAGNSEVVKSKRKTMNNLNLKDQIEDILISLGRQYHLIRPLRARPTLFFYVALDRQRANLAMARMTLADVEKDLVV